MSFSTGSKVKIGATGCSEFIVIEAEYNEDPDVALIKPVLDAGYEFPIRVVDLVLIEGGLEAD